jgi:rRNA maturation endonuclease Nob1
MAFQEYIDLCLNYNWVCTNCGEEAFRRHKFCSGCGGIMHTRKKEKRLCPRGHKVEKDEKFCPKCGTSLNG